MSNIQGNFQIDLARINKKIDKDYKEYLENYICKH